MTAKHFAQVQPDAILAFGGYQFIRPETWENFLSNIVQTEYPDYFLRHQGKKDNDDLWREKEGCILDALEEYLLKQFGVCIPEDNLFKIYNERGEGLELGIMLEAISAVIEPIGFEIEWVLACDAEIRQALGEKEKVIDCSQSHLVNGRPGICMINVEAGYSHAFFWEKIDRRGFKDAKFRMVLVIRKRDGGKTPCLSAIGSADEYLESLKKYINQDPFFQNRLRDLVDQILINISELQRFIHDPKVCWHKNLREEAERQLIGIVSLFLDGIAANAVEDGTVIARAGHLYEGGQMVHRIFRDIKNIR